MTMITTGKLDNLFSLSIASCQANSTHTRLGTTIDKADFLHMGHHRERFLSNFCLYFGRHPKGRTALGALGYRFDNRRIGMTKEQRPPGGYIVDELIPIGII